MTIRLFAGVGFWIVIASAAAIGQQPGQSVGLGPRDPAERAILRTYPRGDVLSSRRVETVSESGNREVRTDIVETPDSDGRLRPSEEAITETTRRAPNVLHTERAVFTYLAPGQRTPRETIESEEEILADGSTRTVEIIWVPDSSGRPGLASRQIQQTTSTAPDVKQTDTAVFQPGTDGALQENERLQQTERQLGPDVLQTISTRSVRDINSRFQRTEERSHEVRTIGPTQYLEEETIHRLDTDGKLSLSERNVIRRSMANGQDQLVQETFSRSIGALMHPDNRMALSQRVRRTTTTAADGGGQTIEELEARNPVSPNDPLRMVRRTVETIRKVSDGRWQTEREVFVLDVNSRWALVMAESGVEIER